MPACGVLPVMIHNQTITFGASATFSALSMVAAGSDGTAGQEYFETHIRPLFAEHCYKCHSVDAEKLKANLYLDSRAGWQTGGDSGPAIVPGDPEQSLLIRAVSHAN